MTKVALIGCTEYESAELKEKIRHGLELAGFNPKQMNGKRVAIKPNLLSAAPPEKAVVTHPEFFRAVVRLIKEEGGKPVLIESPAFQSLARVMKTATYDRIIAEEAITVDPMTGTLVIMNELGRKYKRFEVTNGIADVDLLINLPKFKTHGLTYVTGAVKNLFGLIPGRAKTQWHLRANTREEFNAFMLDLYGAYVQYFSAPKQIVHVMDAIIGMQGDGPGTSGTPRAIGAILCGTDAVAVDFLATNIVGLDVNKVPTIIHGARRGLGFAAWSEIEVVGEDWRTLRVHDFKPAPLPFHTKLERFPRLQNHIKNLMVEKPIPIKEKCILCYQCQQICPAGAIAKGDEVPLYDYNACIRCYCCMEICPEGAIRVQGNIIQRLLKG